MRLRVSAGVVALTATCAFAGTAVAGAAVASASASSTAARDAASTRAFIAGELATGRAMLAHGPAELAAGKAYVAGVKRECGNVRLTLPRKPGPVQVFVLIKFAVEVGVSYDDVMLASARPAIDRIARAQQRLRFSDPTLQWRVHAGTSAFATALALRPPDICADTRRLAATKFTAMTPAGTRFTEDVLTLAGGEADPAALMREMRAYAPAAVASGLRRYQTLNKRMEHTPAARLSNRLFRLLLGQTTTSSGPSTLIGTKL